MIQESHREVSNCCIDRFRRIQQICKLDVIRQRWKIHEKVLYIFSDSSTLVLLIAFLSCSSIDEHLIHKYRIAMNDLA